MKIKVLAKRLFLLLIVGAASFTGVEVAVPGTINRVKWVLIQPGMTEQQVDFILRRPMVWGFGSPLGRNYDCYTDGENSIVVEYTFDRKVVDARYYPGIKYHPFDAYSRRAAEAAAALAKGENWRP